MSDPSNIISAFFETATSLGERSCAHFEDGGKWKCLSWTEMMRFVKNASALLVRHGLKRGDRVIIFGNTRLEWVIADFAVMAAGGISVPVYQSFNAQRVAHILKDARPRIAIVENDTLLAILDEAIGLIGSKDVITVISMEDGGGIISLSSMKIDVDADELRSVEEIGARLCDSDVATYVYTSGTTGTLKGVVLTHGNIYSEIRAIERVFDFGPDDIGLLWLPLAHVLGRMLEVFLIVHGCQTALASDINRLPEVYREIRPHFVCGVPRMLEKIHEAVDAYVKRSNFLARKLFAWAFDVGARRGRFIQKRRPVPFFLSLKFAVALALVFRRLKARLGGRLKCFICGGAMLPDEIGKFFHSAGITVLEGYGLTETFAAVTVNRFDDFHFGTVGKPLHGVDLKLAGDGEILIRGPTVFREYLNLPEETKKAFDDDGWFRTGDIGEYSRDGFLRITGRKKDMIITAGGKNIAPQMIEGIMSDSPYINHFMVYGEGRKYLAALVTLNADDVLAYLKKHGYPIEEGTPLSRHPAVIRLIQKHVDEGNMRLAKFETVKRFAIIDQDFSMETGELTPTMKLRRKAVIDKYRDVVEGMY